MPVSNRLTQIAEAAHQRLFGHAMSDEMRGFLGQLSWSFVGGLLASAVMFLLTVLAGRWLGPELYGRYNELLSFATALSVVFVLGANVSSVRFLSDKRHESQKGEILTTSVLVVLICSVVVGGGLLLAPEALLLKIGIGSEVVAWGVALAAAIGFKSLFDGCLRAFGYIKAQSLLRFVEALLILVVFVTALQGMRWHSHLAYAAGLLAGEVLFCLVALAVLRHFFGRFSPGLLRESFASYNAYLIIGTVLGMAVATDRFLIGTLIGVRELGIYGAYYSASHLVVAELGAIFLNVFWPTVIRNVDNLQGILRKARLLFFTLSPLWIASVMLITFVFVYLFGREYPLEFGYLFLFAFNAYVSVVFSVYLSFLNVDHIGRSQLMNGIFVVVSIATLVLTRSVTAYLVSQAFVQIVLMISIMGFFAARHRETA